MKPVHFHAAAKQELDDAIGHYQGVQDGLGLDLHAEANRVMSSISQDPQIGPPFRKKYRFRRLKRFPYVVYYRELVNSVWIIAFAHESRRPNYWRRRKVT